MLDARMEACLTRLEGALARLEAVADLLSKGLKEGRPSDVPVFPTIWPLTPEERKAQEKEIDRIIAQARQANFDDAP